MEDAEKQALGDATGPPHGAVQLGQSPVELLRLLGLDRHAGFILLLCHRRILTHTPSCIRPHTTVENWIVTTERDRDECQELKGSL